MAVTGDFLSHLQAGHTTICRAWMVRRKDGSVHGFTDHDNDLTFDGVTFKSGSGLTANALSQTTGLSVDNTEAAGVLSDDSVTEDDLKAGLFDGAEVVSWIVNWTNPEQRAVLFRGELGEVQVEQAGFTAELRGLSEQLNQVQGQVYQRGCSAQLGDTRCGIDLNDPAYWTELTVAGMESAARLQMSGTGSQAEGWFEHGTLIVLDGYAAGLSGHVKYDRVHGSSRFIELWEELRGGIAPGDRVRLVAGCDKRRKTCRVKFGNFLNFRGFPHIPGEDWLIAYPTRGTGNTGGSRY